MKRAILMFVCAMAGASILLTALCIQLVLYWDYSRMMRSSVAAESGYIRAAVESSGAGFLRTLDRPDNAALSTRVTLIAADGRALFDTDAVAEDLENHLSRPEIQSALQTGAGEATRFSQTMAKQTYYYALRLRDGTALRLARTTDSILVSLARIAFLTLGIALAVFLAALKIGSRITGTLVRSIIELDLDSPENNVTYEELTPLLSRMKKQNDVIAAQIAEQRKKQLEFTAITDNMREGLIVLDGEGTILSCNKSALELLDIHQENIENKNVLVIRREETFRRAVETALSGTAAETLLSMPAGRLQVFANPVTDSNAVPGAVLVILDVTEREDRERLRREFSANVSHELKTPLMAISGRAEIMAGGLVKPEDMLPFAEKIYNETQRLIALINDILLLSRFDEGEKGAPAGAGPEKEEIDLLPFARNIVDRIAPAAADRLLYISLEGENAKISGAPHILDEMIFNLLDNAVKYNKQGGSIVVGIQKTKTEILLSVADTGIGISPAEQKRIFERFYRVDKSRSKDAGGTGLGLSIVKHGALIHGAKIEVESAPNAGARFTLRFPAAGAP
ncbi:MAG: PAS domain S-box protein [Treponema sp.]|nr:PAS domain S-box protein [Treponema sp.]